MHIMYSRAARELAIRHHVHVHCTMECVGEIVGMLTNRANSHCVDVIC